MNSKEYLSRYAQAKKGLEQKESDLTTIVARKEDFAHRLLLAQLDRAQIDRDAEALATNVRQSPDELQQSLRSLAARRSEVDEWIAGLDRALTHLASTSAQAEAEILCAERACMKAKREYFAAKLDDELRAFIDSNSQVLRRLHSLGYCNLVMSGTNTRSFLEARQTATRDFELVLDSYLTPRLKALLNEDEAHLASVGSVERGEPTLTDDVSPTVSTGKRVDVPLPIRESMNVAAVVAQIEVIDRRAHAVEGAVEADVVSRIAARKNELDQDIRDLTTSLDDVTEPGPRKVLADRIERLKLKRTQLDGVVHTDAHLAAGRDASRREAAAYLGIRSA